MNGQSVRILVPSAPVGKWQPTVCGGLCALRSAPLQVKQVSSAQPLQSCAATTAVRQQQVSAGYSSSPQLDQPPAQLFAAAAATHLRRSHLLASASSTLLLGSPSCRAQARAPTASPLSRFGFPQTSLSAFHRTTPGPTSAFHRLSQLPFSAGSPSAHLHPPPGHLAPWVPPPAQNLPPILFRHLWLHFINADNCLRRHGWYGRVGVYMICM